MSSTKSRTSRLTVSAHTPSAWDVMTEVTATRGTGQLRSRSCRSRWRPLLPVGLTKRTLQGFRRTAKTAPQGPLRAHRASPATRPPWCPIGALDSGDRRSAAFARRALLGRCRETKTPIEGAHMSDDAKAAKELVETLKDGERGYASSAEKLRDGDRPEWATTLQRLS